jgi:hypothetical protein
MPVDEWPNDAELHRLFRESKVPSSTIDAAAIIRRSKRRRLPQQIGAGSALTLAVAGIGIASINGIRLPSMVGTVETTADTLSGESSGAAESAAPWSTEATGCETPVPAAESSRSALRVAVDFPDGRAGEPIVGSVLLTNTSADQFNGWVSAPIVHVMRDGVAVAHNDANPSSAMRIELAPGESRSLVASVDTVQCGHGSDLVRAGAALAPGEYEVVATVTATSDPDEQAPISSDSGGPETVNSVPTTVTLG